MKKLSKKTINLLNKVKAHILEEPKRLDMHNFAQAFVDTSKEDSSIPACQTQGCIAGWAILLKKPTLWKEFIAQAAEQGYNEVLEDLVDPEIEGGSILGLDNEQRERLFYFTEWSSSELGWPEKFSRQYEAATTPRGRANATARRIDHFIATNGAE